MKDLNPVDNYLHGSWEALGNGAPTLVALAQLCTDQWVHGNPNHDQPQHGDSGEPAKSNVALDRLTLEAKAVLFAARDRGVIEIRAVNSAFDAAARLLAVYVEVDEDRTIAFRDPNSPEITIQFLDGFRCLCSHGLVIHHIYRDFTLSPLGWQLARKLKQEDVQPQLDMATEFGLHDL